MRRRKPRPKIFEATYTGANPTKTQKVLQAMQRVYLDYNREQQKLRLTKGLAFIDEQLPKVRQNVAQAEAALEEFRRNQNLIEPEAQAKTLTEAINKLSRSDGQIRLREGSFRLNTTLCSSNLPVLHRKRSLQHG
jgi:succinoglycan biosynthesis transport protein ExoP